MKRRIASSKLADDTLTENGSLGEETRAPGPLSDGEANGLTEQNPPLTPEPSNGTALDFSNHSEPHLEAPAPPPPTAADETRALLEERLHRLEDALARLREHQENQARQATAPTALVAPVAQLVPPPAPITTEAASSFLFHVGKHMLAPTPFTAAAQPTHPAQETSFAAGMRWTWFFFDAYAELRAILRMFVDPRYQMSWTSRLVPLLLAVLLFTSAFWAPGTSLPGIGTLLDKIIDLPLAFLFFKVLSHEARRYRQVSPDLPAALRLPSER